MKLKKFIGDKAFYKYVLAIVLPILFQNGLNNLVNLLDKLKNSEDKSVTLVCIGQLNNFANLIKTDKELVFKGGFENNNNEGSRLLTLYNQDENGVKSASYTLTAPKATFQQDGSKIKGGTFKGDVYVECNNFELVDATIDGNVYFKTQEAKDTFKMDDTSKVTGKMEVQQ